MKDEREDYMPINKRKDSFGKNFGDLFGDLWKPLGDLHNFEVGSTMEVKTDFTCMVRLNNNLQQPNVYIGLAVM